ncbi:hypothetical protein [Gulosibacter sp. 10]|uniref:hypothetical protein n=1 Tax=Gulosibacter sp. 10 TaxID=1255570 RepID=UPI000B34EF45|nr:hypothetical protein [Gulosibacter sp. 10]
MGIFSRRSRRGRGFFAKEIVELSGPMTPADLGVPEFEQPEYVRLHVLGSDLDVQPFDSEFIVDVEAPGREPYRGRIRSGTTPSSLRGLVIDWRVPGLVDRADPEQIVVLEPPCGPDLPLVEPEVQANRDARDLRTAEILGRYPVPSAAQLHERMRPTAPATHPLWDAVCFRMGLLSSAEATAVLDRIRAEGDDWSRASRALHMSRPSFESNLFREQGKALAHLDDVAPFGKHFDEQPLMTIGMAVLQHELMPEQTHPAAYQRVIRPFTEVCGPIEVS